MNQSFLQPLQINNWQELGDLADELGLPPAASLAKITLKFFQQFDDPTVEIRYHVHTIPDSYAKVPQMFARLIEIKTRFPVVQSLLKGDYLVVIGGDVKIPTTFKSKAIAEFKRSGRFICHKVNMPASYQKNPHLLTAILKKETAFEIAMVAKVSCIIWKKKKTN